MAAKRALVSGASGFVGQHLAKRLVSEGWTVTALVRAGGSTRFEDRTVAGVDTLEDPGTTGGLCAITSSRQFTHCFHLATHFVAHHRPEDVDALIEANLAFATRFVEAAVSTGCANILNVSTAWQHYEGARYSPVSLYAATKQAFEDILAYYATVTRVTTLTIPDTYGPQDDRRKLLGLLIGALRNGTRLEMSSVHQLVDLLYVDDVVDALLAAAHSESPPGVWAATSGAPISVRQLVEALRETAGREVPVEFGVRPERAREMRAPWNLGEVLPGWEPKTSLSDGLLMTLRDAGLIP